MPLPNPASASVARPHPRGLLLALALLLPLPRGVAADPPPAAPNPPTALEQTVAALDQRLFAAYDAHDVAALMAQFEPGLEFFHDTGGLLGWAQVKEGFAGVFARNPDIRRTLVPGSLRVFPIKGYGAIQLGAHRFCHTEKGKLDCGTFQFMHVWHEVDGAWRVARVVSWDHR